jgi:hypothetical protein
MHRRGRAWRDSWLNRATSKGRTFLGRDVAKLRFCFEAPVKLSGWGRASTLIVLSLRFDRSLERILKVVCYRGPILRVPECEFVVLPSAKCVGFERDLRSKAAAQSILQKLPERHTSSFWSVDRTDLASAGLQPATSSLACSLKDTWQQGGCTKNVRSTRTVPAGRTILRWLRG